MNYIQEERRKDTGHDAGHDTGHDVVHDTGQDSIDKLVNFCETARASVY